LLHRGEGWKKKRKKKKKQWKMMMMMVMFMHEGCEQVELERKKGWRRGRGREGGSWSAGS
jgi:hypothetical protein